MGLYRDDEGLVFEADDKFGQSMGYEPVSPAEEADIHAKRGLAQRADEEGSGIASTVNAGASRLLSGATMGLSDVALGATLPDEYRKRLVSDVNAHPYLSTAAELAGNLGSALAEPGSLLSHTPTGYLAGLASHEIESGLAQGGVAGVSKALGVMGTEGALQSGGQYIGHAALEDADTTAEGLAGALGTGFLFGAGGGGAALGVSHGAMAARKMFARTMGDTDAKVAESAWTIAREEALQADATTAQAAQAKLDELRQMKADALRGRNETRAATRDEQVRAQRVGPETVPEAAPAPAEGPEPLIDVSAQPPGMPTSVFRRPDALDPAAAREFDASLPRAEEPPLASDALMAKPISGQVTSVKAPTTKKIPRPEGLSAVQSDLEAQLAGTKAKLDSGESLADVGAQAERPIKASKGNESDSIEKWLAEARDHSSAKKTADLEALREMGMRRGSNDTLAEMRAARTEELLGKPIANTESDLIAALDEFEQARKGFLDMATHDFSITLPAKRGVPGDFLKGQKIEGALSNEGSLASGDVARLREPPTGAGHRRTMDAVDTAHEEALMHARETNDPRAAGQALQEADRLEQILLHLSAGGKTHVPTGDFASDIGQKAKIIDRYEKASAKIADVAGDAAHPVSAAKAKAYAQANDEAVRKATDRSARAVDDNETFGPSVMTSKDRVLDAKERQNEATKHYDNVSADMIDAQDAASKAKAQYSAAERAKKGALRVDAKAARTTGRGADMAAKALGVNELLDLPGMPKVHNLPVVGPLLSAYLKYRTLKGALGRSMGVVTATADSRVAALASRTRDRIARAVDRSLGALEAGGKYATRMVPPVAGALAARLYDDGLPSPKPNAPIGELAAARIRELAAYVHTPNAIENDVRKQLRGVIDPDVITAAEKQRRVAMEYLLANAPKAPEQGMLQTVKWQPSPAESMSLDRRWAAINDPAAVYEHLAAANRMLSLEAADALLNVYPQLFAQAQQRVVEKIGEAHDAKSIPYRTRLQMSLLYKLPLDAALSPDNLKISQSVYDRKPMVPPGAPPAPPTPSIAGGTNLTALFQTPADRRALR